jgi:hypothetical protein
MLGTRMGPQGVGPTGTGDGRTDPPADRAGNPRGDLGRELGARDDGRWRVSKKKPREGGKVR